MTALALTPAQRKEQRAAAHHLEPVVAVGADGINDAVIKEIGVALAAHGLVKVRVFNDVRSEREAMLERLADALDAAAVQHIGKLLVLWRPLPDKPRAPSAEGGEAPRIVKVLKFGKVPGRPPQIKRLRVLGNERLTPGGIVKRAKKRQTSIKKKLA